ncbi:hypothetical protein M407DRAFT_243201 [Tulasnella calospora MUT 4182]|uniref:Uncharacterized protein n=1 Tax=Tulasnella calospora MUT 4182 TaxID=1051891 RepID=A0A0C3L2F5_9AGAM|nr:hypothetical protein M407DRAFT_243201 [Tulasnella calospora MUT 4182]
MLKIGRIRSRRRNNAPPSRQARQPRPTVIALYLNHLIQSKELSKSSLDSAYLTFINYFGEMEEGRYKKGDWRLQEGSNNQYAGSPVHSFIVQRIIKILKREITVNSGI